MLKFVKLFDSYEIEFLIFRNFPGISAFFQRKSDVTQYTECVIKNINKKDIHLY